MSFGQIRIKTGLRAGLKRVCGRVCPDTMNVGLKLFLAATGGTPLNRLLSTTRLGAAGARRDLRGSAGAAQRNLQRGRASPLREDPPAEEPGELPRDPD